MSSSDNDNSDALSVAISSVATAVSSKSADDNNNNNNNATGSNNARLVSNNKTLKKNTKKRNKKNKKKQLVSKKTFNKNKGETIKIGHAAATKDSNDVQNVEAAAAAPNSNMAKDVSSLFIGLNEKQQKSVVQLLSLITGAGKSKVLEEEKDENTSIDNSECKKPRAAKSKQGGKLKSVNKNVLLSSSDDDDELIQQNHCIDDEDNDNEGAVPISIPYLENQIYNFSKLITPMYKNGSKMWEMVAPDHLPSVGPVTDDYVTRRMSYVFMCKLLQKFVLLY